MAGKAAGARGGLFTALCAPLVSRWTPMASHPHPRYGGRDNAPGERVGAESAVGTPAADPRNLTWLAPA